MQEQRSKIEEKVVEILTLIEDEEKVREGRKKARENKDKYIGISSSFGSSQQHDQVIIFEEENIRRNDQHFISKNAPSTGSFIAPFISLCEVNSALSSFTLHTITPLITLATQYKFYGGGTNNIITCERYLLYL